MRRWLYYIAGMVAVWLVFFAIISTLPLLSGVFTWDEALRMNLNQWLPWMLLSPLAVWFSLRFPIEWSGWHRHVLVHIIVGILLVLASVWVGQYTSIPPSPRFGRYSDRQQFEDRRPPFGDSQFDHDRDRGLPPSDGDQNGPPADLRSGSPPPGGPPHGNYGRRGPPFWARAGFNLPVYLTIVSLCHAFIYFRRTQQRDRHALELESQLGQARLQTLRMQLQPHFLFNTLNAISTLVQTNPPAAQEMIGSLGQMLRLSLDSGSHPEVPLGQELQFLDCYLEIAQTRFGDRLQVKYDIAPETGKALVPTFILQPLVENAVRHGIEPGTGPGTIEINVRRSGNQLIIAIRDTGVGLVENNGAGEISEKGIGIANTKARLQSLYPKQHHFSVRNAPGGGCLAELEIPFHKEPLTSAMVRNQA